MGFRRATGGKMAMGAYIDVRNQAAAMHVARINTAICPLYNFKVELNTREEKNDTNNGKD